jgi:universal stress protein E
MNAESRVLAVIDPETETDRAAERGARLAEGLGLPLELLDVVYDQFVENDEKAVTSLMEHRRQSAQALAKYFGQKIAKLAIEVRWGPSQSDQVLKRVDETKPAFVVKSTHHHSVLERTLFSNSDWELIRHCPAPLVLVKDRDISDSPRLLAAVDPANDEDEPEALNLAILEIGKLLSAGLAGSLRPVHVLNSEQLTRIAPAMTAAVMTPAVSAVPVTEPLTADEVERVKRARRNKIDRLAVQAGLDADDSLLLIGDPGSCLI